MVLIGSLISTAFCQTGEAIQLSPSCTINAGKMSVLVTVSQITLPFFNHNFLRYKSSLDIGRNSGTHLKPLIFI